MNHHKWTTQDEFAYLAKIGMHMLTAPALNRRAKTYEQHRATMAKLRHQERLLTGYVTASALREDWGEMDRRIIVTAATEELAVVRGFLKEGENGDY